jgi:uncharacterized protein YgiM (DUF1202 family)
MKKIFFLIIPALLIAVLIFLFIQYLSNQRSQKGALQVTSSPQSKVYIDNKYIGRTPITKTDPKDMIQAGNYTIKLEPSDPDLSEYQEKITISTGILTVVDRKFNKGSLSEGYVITLSPLSEKKRTELEVVSFPSGSKVELDSNDIGKTPLLHKSPTESDHMLRIRKDGYKDKTVRIRTPYGYRLTVIAYLGVTSENDLDNTPTPSAVLTPTPTAATSKVQILDTPTGFLRVRSSNNLNSSIITTVAPGETYPLISEQTGWFEIKLHDGKTGWVNTQYARKL